MTNEEAIKLLENSAIMGVTIDKATPPLAEAVRMAIDALKIRIPSKITHNFKCPACYADVIGSGNYCWKCGQHLDWGT